MTMTSTIVGKNPQKKWSSPHNQQESKMQYLGATTKVAEDLGSFQGKPSNVTVTQIYASTTWSR